MHLWQKLLFNTLLVWIRRARCKCMTTARIRRWFCSIHCFPKFRISSNLNPRPQANQSLWPRATALLWHSWPRSLPQIPSYQLNFQLKWRNFLLPIQYLRKMAFNQKACISKRQPRKMPATAIQPHLDPSSMRASVRRSFLPKSRIWGILNPICKPRSCWIPNRRLNWPAQTLQHEMTTTIFCQKTSARPQAWDYE